MCILLITFNPWPYIKIYWKPSINSSDILECCIQNKILLLQLKWKKKCNLSLFFIYSLRLWFQSLWLFLLALEVFKNYKCEDLLRHIGFIMELKVKLKFTSLNTIRFLYFRTLLFQIVIFITLTKWCVFSLYQKHQTVKPGKNSQQSSVPV